MSPAAATTPTTVVISVNPRKLPLWRPAYGRVTISAAGASNSPQVVDVVVGQTASPLGLPSLAFSDSAIGFCYFPAASRGCVRLAEHVLFTSTGASLAWKAVSSKPWIVIQPATGATDTDVRVSVDFAKLPALENGLHHPQRGGHGVRVRRPEQSADYSGEAAVLLLASAAVGPWPHERLAR